MPKIHVATSREIGQMCKMWAKMNYYRLVPMEECDIFISVLYDRIIPESYIKEHKCFNFHPGILPEYRGAGAYSWVIINGERETGVTLHEIDKDIDTGPIIEIRRFPVTEKSTAGSLFKTAEDTIMQMFKEWLPRLITGEYETTPQSGGAIYYRNQLERAKDLTRFIRAFTFPGKENAYFINNVGNKVHIDYESPPSRD